MASFVSLCWISGVTLICFSGICYFFADCCHFLLLKSFGLHCCSLLNSNPAKGEEFNGTCVLSHNLGFAASVFQDHTLLQFQTACMHPWSRCWSLIVSQSYRTHKKFKTKAKWRWEYVGVSWCLDSKAETCSRCSLFLLSHPQQHHWSL